ncbi:hypothetical protein EB796_007870 [Bugula neritina]|uniref:Uncharacterized protein n=1 Tax=Bugula neritina TaxID=10212 RepID=A0A7J7K6I1_BUGNE|nr:hypothetical protein EB796_007870 [Bugula neritina]
MHNAGVIVELSIKAVALEIFLFTAIVIVYRGDATPEEEKAKADDLIKELDKPHNKIRGTLMTQLKRIAGELRGYYNQRPNHDYTQWVVATPLNIERSTESGAEPLILTKQGVKLNKHIYSNFKKMENTAEKNNKRKKYCNANCIKEIEKLPTTIKRDRKELGNGHVIHTEIQMLHRIEKDNILHDKANLNKVILLYSKYIPCSQNQNAQGGTFVECAGELANFMANRNPNGNKLIVFYETQHTAEDHNNRGVRVSSVVGVSQLYMEMSGIVAFKYTPEIKTKRGIPNIPSNLQRDPQLVERAAYFREYPKFINLGRPLITNGYNATVTQMFIDCLARNNFVTTETSIESTLDVQFITAKHFLSLIPYAKENDIKKLFEMANQADKKTKKQYAFIKGCYKFAKYMSTDDIKKGLIVPQKVGDYLNFNGYATRLNKSKKINELSVNSERDACEPFLAALKKFFKRESYSTPVCKVKDYTNRYSNSRSYRGNGRNGGRGGRRRYK